MKFILSIDTEADNQWNHGIPISTKNISFIPAFQELCNQHHIFPTYLVTSEICEDKDAVSILKRIHENNQCEIGTHLHVWTTPPFLDKDGCRYNDPSHAFAHEIPSDLFEKKLEFLTSQIKASFGHHPVSFRSGRYGFDKSMARVLVGQGYKVDSSVTPFISWKSTPGLPSGAGGPDFTAERNNHYFINTQDGKLLEVPITIQYTKDLLIKNPGLTRFLVSHRNRYLNKLLSFLDLRSQPLWLRPKPDTSLEDLKEIVDTTAKNGLEYIVMMFHSSELMPGCSPYWKDKDDVARLFNLLSEFFLFLRSKEIPSIKLCDTIHNKADYK